MALSTAAFASEGRIDVHPASRVYLVLLLNVEGEMTRRQADSLAWNVKRNVSNAEPAAVLEANDRL
jgi:hypothetical protein